MSAAGRGADRSGADYYPTPAWCVRRLLERCGLPGGRWLEPAAGDGAIIRAVGSSPRIRWTAVELRPDCEPALRPVAPEVIVGDFFDVQFSGRFNVAILNPPFSLALAFVERCLTLADHVAVLLRLNWLEGAERHPLLSRSMPDVYVLPNRPSFVDGGTDATAYAWMVWRRERVAMGGIRVLALTSAEERGEDPRQERLPLSAPDAPHEPRQQPLFGGDL